MSRIRTLLLFLSLSALLALVIVMPSAQCGEEAATTAVTSSDDRYILNKTQENNTPLFERSYGVDFLGRRVRSNLSVDELLKLPISENVYHIGVILADLEAVTEAVREQMETGIEVINPCVVPDIQKNCLAAATKITGAYGKIANAALGASPEYASTYDMLVKSQSEVRALQGQVDGLRFKQYGPPTSYTIKIRFNPDQQGMEGRYLDGRPIDFTVTYVPKNLNPKDPAIALNPQDRPSSKVVGVRLDSDGYYAVMICDDFDRFEPSSDGWTTIPIAQALGGLREARAKLMLVNVYGVLEPNNLFRLPALVAATTKQ